METFGKYKFVPLFLSGTGSNLYQRRNVPLQLHFNEKFRQNYFILRWSPSLSRLIPLYTLSCMQSPLFQWYTGISSFYEVLP